LLCKRCQYNNVEAGNFCTHCGFRLHPARHAAPAFNGPPGDKVLLDASAKDRPSDGERKLITALIVDIKDSVVRIGSLDPDKTHRILHSVLGIMVDSVVKFGGNVLQPTGDGIFAVFGVPLAAQDHAHRAVYASLDLQQRLRAYAGERRDDEPLIEIRIGIESGEIVLRDLDTGQGTALITVGATVNLAARLQSVAPAGSVVVGEQTRRLIDGYFSLRTLPSATVKGVPQPIEVHEVIGLGRLRRHSQIAARRGFSTFVGRDAELLQLCQALDRAADGTGQVVSIVTGPGMGKSRLLLEFSRTLPFDCKIFEAYAVSYARNMPWLPIIGMLQDYFEISDVDDPAVRRGKIAAAVAALPSGLSETLPFLFGLFGVVVGPDPLREMDPFVRYDRIIEAIIKIFLAESLDRPVVLIFEDLHWIDDQTKSLLSRLATSINSARILVLTSYRPEYVPNWGDADHVTDVALGPLSRGSSEILLSALLGEDSELSDLKGHISDRTAGNPFFIEEMVNALFEDGTLTRNATIQLTKPIAELRVPMTVRGLLLERIDQSGPQSKQLLQLLSVIGQTLPLDLVFEASPWPSSQTAQLMSDLQAADFIYVQSDIQQGANRIDYTFKHALTYEVAYQTILGDRRKLLHKHVAVAIESVYRDFLDDQIAILAHHYSAAEDHAKAIEYLGKAGRQALQKAAYADAISAFREALRLVDLVPEGMVRPADQAVLWSSLATSLLVTHGYAHKEVRLAYGRARDFSSEAGDHANLALVLRGLFLFDLTSANYQAARRTGREMMELGSQDEAYSLEGRVVMATAYIYTGDFPISESLFAEALSFSNNNPDFVTFQYTGHTYTLCLAYHAICLSYLGKIERSLTESLEATIVAKAISVPITTAQALAARAATLHRLRYYREAEGYYDQAISCSTLHGLPYWSAFCSMGKAALVTEREGFGASFADFERSQQDYQRSGARLMMSWFLYLRTEILAKAGKIPEAMACIEETLEFIGETGETVVEAEVHRLKATLLFRERDRAARCCVDQVEACLVKSLAVARRQQAKLWELRAATSFACLRAWEGRFGDGYELLAPVCGWFTAGLDPPDLADARRLLDYLAGAGRGAYPSSDIAGSALLPP
jgi:class 3 adenylate cyclase/tetratricopeptide (TPR) repeat protein